MSDQVKKQFEIAEEGLRRSNSLDSEQAAEARRVAGLDSHTSIARDDDDDAERAYRNHGGQSRDAETTPGEAVLSWAGGDPVSHPSSPTSEPRSAAAETTAGVSGTEIPPSAAKPEMSLDDIRRRQARLDAEAYQQRRAAMVGSYFHEPMLHSQATDADLTQTGIAPLVPVASNFGEGLVSGVDAIVAATETRSRR